MLMAGLRQVICHIPPAVSQFLVPRLIPTPVVAILKLTDLASRDYSQLEPLEMKEMRPIGRGAPMYQRFLLSAPESHSTKSRSDLASANIFKDQPLNGP